MTKPDFRAVVSARLRAERRTDLSDPIVRLLTPGRNEAAPGAPGSRSAAGQFERRGAGVSRSRRAAQPPPAAIPDHELHDPATGLLSARAWESVFSREESRFARYGQPVTVLVAEIEGLDPVADRFGEEAAARLLGPVAAAIRGSMRASDVIARTGPARFEGLLAGTSATAAAGQATRVRAACDEWLEAGRVSARLAIGWAQPVPGGRLADARREAEARLEADRS